VTLTAVELLHDGLINLQRDKRRRLTIKEFADYLQENESSLNLMMNGKRSITKGKLLKFGEKLKDNRFYELAGETPPDPDLLYIQQNWPQIPNELRRNLREQAEKYSNKKKKK
jgi:hypothetical protein